MLLEGVPGLAKTLTVRTLADVLGGTFDRVQFTPDLVPADLVGTRIWQPDHGEFRPSSARSSPTSCSPTRSTARPPRCSRALLEVMQEHQVTIGGTTYGCPSRSSCSRPRTRSSPRAPTRCPRRRSTASCSSSSSTTRRSRTRSPSPAASVGEHARARRCSQPDDLLRYRAAAARGARRPRDRDLRGAPRRRDPPARRARPRRPRAGLIAFGASPRASIGLVRERPGARAAARPQARHRRRRPRPRPRRAAPPARALLRRARRRRRRPTSCSTACSTPSPRPAASPLAEAA